MMRSDLLTHRLLWITSVTKLIFSLICLRPPAADLCVEHGVRLSSRPSTQSEGHSSTLITNSVSSSDVSGKTNVNEFMKRSRLGLMKFSLPLYWVWCLSQSETSELPEPIRALRGVWANQRAIRMTTMFFHPKNQEQSRFLEAWWSETHTVPCDLWLGTWCTLPSFPKFPVWISAENYPVKHVSQIYADVFSNMKFRRLEGKLSSYRRPKFRGLIFYFSL